MRAFILVAAMVLGCGAAAFAGEGRYAVIEIKNITSGELKYQVEWGGEKQIFAVAGGESKWHAVELAEGEQIPRLVVTTDVDPTAASRLASFDLVPKIASHPDFGVGGKYTFGLSSDESELEFVRQRGVVSSN